MEAFVENYIAQNLTLLKSLDAGAIACIIAEFGKARDTHKRIYAIGNGGSASTVRRILSMIWARALQLGVKRVLRRFR